MPSLSEGFCWPPARKCASLRKCWDNYNSPNLQLHRNERLSWLTSGPVSAVKYQRATTQAETGFLQHHDRFFTALCASIVLCRSKLRIKASQLFDYCLEWTYNHLVFIRMSLWSDEKNRTLLWHGLFYSDCSPHFWYFKVNIGKQLSKQPLCSNFLGWSHEARFVGASASTDFCFSRTRLFNRSKVLTFGHLWSIVGPVHRHMVPVSEHLTSYLVSSMSAKSLATCERFD